MKDNPYTCPNCGKITNANVISFDNLGWHTSCVYCDASFDIAIEEITTDRERVLIKMPQEQFVKLVLSLDSSIARSVDFYNDSCDGDCYGVMYMCFLDSIILGIGGYGQNTSTLDTNGWYGKELDSSVAEFVKNYLLNERFKYVYVDCDSVDYKNWEPEMFA